MVAVCGLHAGLESDWHRHKARQWQRHCVCGRCRLALNEAQKRTRVGLGDTGLAAVVCEHIEYARAIGIHVRRRRDEAWVQRLVSRMQQVEFSGDSFEAENGDALRIVVRPEVALDMRTGEVVERLHSLYGIGRPHRLCPFALAASGVGAASTCDDEARSRRVDGGEQQGARLTPLVMPGDAPAEAA
eukprot:2365369-Prymnesium_polylepis.2